MSLDSSAPPVQNPPIRRPAAPDGPVSPARFVWESTRMGWRWLTRMRTALWMLLWLGVLTAVATVVPQAPNVPSTVERWLAGEEGPGVFVSGWLWRTGAFDVYGSTIFLALLFALFLSLTACLIPRIRAWVRLVRSSRPPLLRAGSGDFTATFVTDRAPGEVLDAADAVLAARAPGRDGWGVRERWRTRRGGADDAAPAQVAAETGLWSREGGSLTFHLSFYVLLAAIVFGQLLTFEGQRGVVEGEPGFTDAAVSYWTYAPGRWFAEDDHAGWRLDLDAFDVDWIRDPLAPGAGQATIFRSDVTITPRGGDTFTGVVEGNRPLTVDGRKIHQLDWGYAARMIVRDGDGNVVSDGFSLTEDRTGFFAGAVKAPAGEPDIGVELFLYPFAPDGEDGPRLTGAPWDDAPLLLVSVWRGDLRLGVTAQFINELDVDALDLTGIGWLRPGETLVFDDAYGGVEVEFAELRRWVGFQVSSRPQLPWLLLAGTMLSVGLITALYAYRRRLWVVVDAPADGDAAGGAAGGAAAGGAAGGDADGRTLYRVVGRAFQRPDVAEEEHAAIARRIAERIQAQPVDEMSTLTSTST